MLEWKSGQFTSADVALHQQAVADTCALTVHQPLRQEITRVLARHAQGRRAPHILLVRAGEGREGHLTKGCFPV